MLVISACTDTCVYIERVTGSVCYEEISMTYFTVSCTFLCTSYVTSCTSTCSILSVMYCITILFQIDMPCQSFI